MEKKKIIWKVAHTHYLAAFSFIKEKKKKYIINIEEK